MPTMVTVTVTAARIMLRNCCHLVCQKKSKFFVSFFVFDASRAQRCTQRNAMQCNQDELKLKKKKKEKCMERFFFEKPTTGSCQQLPAACIFGRTRIRSHTRTRARMLSLSHTHYILARAWYLTHTCFVNNHLAFLSDTHALSLFQHTLAVW